MWKDNSPIVGVSEPVEFVERGVPTLFRAALALDLYQKLFQCKAEMAVAGTFKDEQGDVYCVSEFCVVEYTSNGFRNGGKCYFPVGKYDLMLRSV